MTQLVTLAEGVHTLESTLRIHAGFYLPVRSTLLRLDDGSLLMISPLRIDDALAARVDALGPISHIVAPSNLHHLFVGEAAVRWPSARVLLPSGLPAKLARLGRAVPLHSVLPADLPSGVQGVLLDGVPAMGETVFFHAASRTLVVTDLVFHVLAPEGLLTGLILRMVGAHRVLAQSRALRLLTRDREAARASLEQVLALDFTRLVMAHGAVVDVDAKARLRGALHYMLRAPRALPLPA
ncbi:MAG: hypothetical protein IPL19_07550 [Sandaracinaceae bacterium]|nr:hypothetical protein [Sandaracinaceae bacterium]